MSGSVGSVRASRLSGALLLLASVVGAVVPTQPADAAPDAVWTLAAAQDASFIAAPAGTSVLLLEAATGQAIVSTDADRRRPIASAVKLVTALAVVEALPPGRVILVGEEVRGIEGSSYGLRPGEARTVEDLLIGLLLRSGNDAAVVLAYAADGSEEAFVLRMQDVLRRLGIDALPASASGLTDGDALTATELGMVARAALAEPRIRSIVGSPELELADGLRVENRNVFVRQFSGATGLKTGFTSAAGYTLAASARRDGRELVAVVLGAPDDLTRRDVAARLLDYGFSQTLLSSVEHSVILRTSRGPVRFATEGVAVTLPLEARTAAAWSPALRPDEDVREVDIAVDGRPAGPATVTRRDARDTTVPSGLGLALADGVYGALRPFGLSGGLR